MYCNPSYNIRLLTLSRLDIAYEVLRTLRTSNIAAVVERLTPLLHMDPVEKLPPEITSEIFAFLEASTLLTASLASRTWRERILESRLWKKLYTDQGWGMDLEEVKTFEDAHSAHTTIMRDEFRKARAHLRSTDGTPDQPLHKRRATSSWLGQRARNDSEDVAQWREQHGAIEADGDSFESGPNGVDQEMSDVSSNGAIVPLSPRRRNKRLSQDLADEMDLSPVRRRRQVSTVPLPIELHPPLRPSLLFTEGSGSERLNWSFLYKQRRRLEDNWAKGRYTNFQLPHPLYPQEAHKECVYTLQFFGKWLVSGSRDKTLRVWDLETRRLRGSPLVGHTQSVLCLQFDPTREEDVIISGSSDTSVIIWRFSTGQKIHEIPQAHRESVLNLRFDHRYLVTCSKDKLIKVWNRHELLPTDPNYPKVNPNSTAKIPSYIVDISSMSPSVLEAKIANRQIKPLQSYTLIMLLDGHGAAVNAIQIDGELIVSASGDRFIKLWRLTDGSIVKTLVGHQKGIACVQSDGKRIVSGSSDNTVRIYDHATGAEVGILHGHTNLVRTVQAGFGDFPGAADDLSSQARAAEDEYVEGVRTGAIVEEMGTRHSSARKTAGDNTHQIRSFGAKVPPGGGGSHWGRIVSGSYDETIIIWKKDADGRWIVGHCLRQEAAVRASAAADMRAYNESRVDAGGAPASPLVTMTGGSSAVGNLSGPLASHVAQQTMQTSMAGLQTGIQNVMNIGSSLGNSALPTTSLSRPPLMAPGAQQAMHQLQSHAQNVMQATLTQAAQQAPTNPAANHVQGAAVSASTAAGTADLQQQQQQQQLTQPTQQPQPQPPAQQPHHHHHHHHHHHNHNNNANANPAVNANAAAQALVAQQSVSRVFKLQFDARRIICCSQDPRIVGWDFAAGDPDIIEASRFFVGP
jgi:F-box and WD-40 domain protein 1/11